ncbi:MAG: hypothetical protein FWD39_03965 [Clostridiales bacterium]|nr:hypothetical protein [Clostridiales bacterium]
MAGIENGLSDQVRQELPPPMQKTNIPQSLFSTRISQIPGSFFAHPFLPSVFFLLLSVQPGAACRFSFIAGQAAPVRCRQTQAVRPGKICEKGWLPSAFPAKKARTSN